MREFIVNGLKLLPTYARCGKARLVRAGSGPGEKLCADNELRFEKSMLVSSPSVSVKLKAERLHTPENFVIELFPLPVTILNPLVPIIWTGGNEIGRVPV